MKNKVVVQVCKSNCAKTAFVAKVGNVTHTFCCEKGFKKSLVDFAKSIKK